MNLHHSFTGKKKTFLALVWTCAMCMLVCAGFTGGQKKAYGHCGDFDFNRIGTRDINTRDRDLNLYSLEHDVELGHQLAAKMEQRTRILEDERIQEYIEALGQEIVRNSDARTGFYFSVIDSREINLFAFPGGHIYVGLGLLASVDTEAELAGLLAHEISHVTARHATEELSRKWGYKEFIKKIPLFKLIPTGDVRKMVLGMSIDFSMLGINIENEKESDCLGAQYTWKTGYAPDGFLSYYRRIKQKYDLTGDKNYQSFMETHPHYENRLSILEEIVESLPEKKRFISSTQDFKQMKEHVVSIKHIKEMKHVAPDREYKIAAYFSPVWIQEIHGNDNADYFTRFDFDGDWIGNNNWENLEKFKKSLQAYLYFSVAETTHHFYILYLAFYPRDWKTGGSLTTGMKKGFKSAVDAVAGNDELSDLMHRLKHSHENDLEGCLVIVKKRGENPENGIRAGMETFLHNRFKKYRAKPWFGSQDLEFDYIKTEDRNHPMVFAESKSHNLHGFTYKVDTDEFRYITFKYGETETANTLVTGGERTYGLIPLFDTLWKKAHQPHGNHTIGKYYRYETMEVAEFLPDTQTTRIHTVDMGTIGITLKGEKNGVNLAQFPWIWKDYKDLRLDSGRWFYDPANAVKTHYRMDDDFPTAYVYNPFVGIGIETTTE